MQELTPVGLSKDGKRLVLVSDSGAEFSVPVDHRLRTALRGDNARLGQLEMRMESALRPRDIQARIRAGESAEDVAAAAGSTVEAIMPFAAPVLAERAHVAELAQQSSVRRRSAESATAGRTLDEAARRHLTSVGVRADDVAWDAWRRDDGRWTLVAEYDVSGDTRRAEFSYDQPGRYVVADNDEARLLTGEASAPAASGETGRRLSSVPPAYDDELPLGDSLGDDAIELVTDRGDADWIAPAEPEAPDAAEATTEVATEPEPEQRPEPAAEAPEPTTEPERPRRKGRSSVPSWDEIMFGGGKTD